MSAPVDQVISTLNSIHVGDLERIHQRLDEAILALRAMQQVELVDKLSEAGSAIRSGDVPLFRKRLQYVVSRLGHLRA